MERDHVFVDHAVHCQKNNLPLNKSDRGLVRELVYGVLRYRETLDWRLSRIANRPLPRWPLAIVMILRVGAYQILYLDRIPVSAAVNESVNMAKAVRGRDWSGLVNGVLRTLARQEPPSWPDVHDNPVTALSIRWSCPSWIVQRWLLRFGTMQTEMLCRATLNIPPITLRTNTLRCSRAQLLERLRREGYDAHETSVSPVGITLKKCGDLQNLMVLQEGWCYVEDEAAQLIPFLLDVHPGDCVLDVCAAPGGKTTHLAALMENQGTLVAFDRHASRLHVLASNCQRLGITNVHPFAADARTAFTQTKKPFPSSRRPHPLSSAGAQGFDRILVDAPCSGFGILRRHPEGKWRKDQDLIHQTHVTQLEILDNIHSLLRPEGVIVYSACSIESEETIQVLSKFCGRHPEFLVESAMPWIPLAGQSLGDEQGNMCTAFNLFDMDGFFAARLRRGTPSS